MIPVLSGYTLIALGLCHTAVGICLYWPALVSMFRDGVIGVADGHTDRLLAFWFLLFSATLCLLGQLLLHAHRNGDAALMQSLHWYIAGIGIIGVIVMPRSPFWCALLIAVVLLWSKQLPG